jgi:outer membrane protein assembly factor BamB
MAINLDANSDVWQLDQRNGASYWKQTGLHQRRLSVPAVYGEYVVNDEIISLRHKTSPSIGVTAFTPLL